MFSPLNLNYLFFLLAYLFDLFHIFSSFFFNYAYQNFNSLFNHTIINFFFNFFRFFSLCLFLFHIQTHEETHNTHTSTSLRKRKQRCKRTYATSNKIYHLTHYPSLIYWDHVMLGKGGWLGWVGELGRLVWRQLCCHGRESK